MGNITDAVFSIRPAKGQKLVGKKIFAAVTAANFAVNVMLNSKLSLLRSNSFGALLELLQVFQLAFESILTHRLAGCLFELPKFFFQIHNG